MCNVQYVLLVDSNYIGVLDELCIVFFVLHFPLIDDGDVAAESENSIFDFLSASFYILNLSNLEALVLCLYLIPKLRFIFFRKSSFDNLFLI